MPMDEKASEQQIQDFTDAVTVLSNLRDFDNNFEGPLTLTEEHCIGVFTMCPGCRLEIPVGTDVWIPYINYRDLDTQPLLAECGYVYDDIQHEQYHHPLCHCKVGEEKVSQVRQEFEKRYVVLRAGRRNSEEAMDDASQP